MQASKEFELHVNAGKAFSKKATIRLFKEIADQLDKVPLTIGDVEKYFPQSEYYDYSVLQEKEKNKKQKLSDYIRENLPAIDKGDEASLKKFANRFGVNSISEIPQAILNIQKNALHSSLKETLQTVKEPLAHAEDTRLSERINTRSKDTKSAVKVVYRRNENTL